MAAKTCEICKTRPQMTAKQRREAGVDFQYCEPCLEMANQENVHSDDAHDALANGGGDPDEFVGGQATVDRIRAEMKDCWVCNPKLDRSAADYQQRAGTSRAGMRLTVPVRANGKTKAEAVKAQLPEGYAVTIRTVKGRTTLKAAKAAGIGITLHWDAYRGAFLGGAAQNSGQTTKRVRNASEALRLLGV